MVCGSIVVGKSLLSGRGLHPPLLRQIVRGLASLLWGHGRLDHWRRRKLYFHQDHKLYSSLHVTCFGQNLPHTHSYTVTNKDGGCWEAPKSSSRDYCCGVESMIIDLSSTIVVASTLPMVSSGWVCFFPFNRKWLVLFILFFTKMEKSYQPV